MTQFVPKTAFSVNLYVGCPVVNKKNRSSRSEHGPIFPFGGRDRLKSGPRTGLRRVARAGPQSSIAEQKYAKKQQ